MIIFTANNNFFSLNTLFWLLALGVFGFFLGKFTRHKSLYPFIPFSYDFRKRRDTFLKPLDLLEKD